MTARRRTENQRIYIQTKYKDEERHFVTKIVIYYVHTCIFMRYFKLHYISQVSARKRSSQNAFHFH